MPQTPIIQQGLSAADVHSKINLLVHNLVRIEDKTGQFLLRLPDGRIIDTKGWNDWEWSEYSLVRFGKILMIIPAHGIGLYGLWQYYMITGHKDILEIIEDWFSKQLAMGTTKNINTMSPFLTLASLYEQSKRPEHLPWLESWAEWAMNDLERTPFGGMQHVTYLSKHDGQLWDDTLMMTVMPLAKIGVVLRRPDYIEEAKRQFLTHITYLFDTHTHTFFHGWQFNESASGDVGHNFARARWARGNCWITMAILEFLELLDAPANDGFRIYLTSILEAQCGALRRLQDPSGLWRTLLDVPQSEGSYVESSATAGFAYGILKAVRKGYISKDFKDTGIRAIKAILKKINEEGELTDTSFGTGMGQDLEHYLKIRITSMPYGQALAIMALVEFLHFFC
jgi:unsaturated rhamnogalacturonyl hydrolase